MLQILINESSSEVCFIYEPGVISTVNMLTKFIFIIKFDGSFLYLNEYQIQKLSHFMGRTFF